VAFTDIILLTATLIAFEGNLSNINILKMTKTKIDQVANAFTENIEAILYG